MHRSPALSLRRPLWGAALLLLATAPLACSDGCGGAAPTSGPQPSATCPAGLVKAGWSLAQGGVSEARLALPAETPAGCPQVPALRGVALMVDRKLPEAWAELGAVVADAQAQPQLKATAELLQAVERSGSQDPAEIAAAVALTASALQRDPGAWRARLIRGVLLRRESEDASRAELAHLATVEGLRQVRDSQDLMLKELAAWILDILSTPEGLAPWATREEQFLLVRLLDELGNRRWGAAFRRIKEQELVLLRSLWPRLADMPLEALELESDIAWGLQDFPAVEQRAREYAAAHPETTTPVEIQLRALNRLGRYEDLLRVAAPAVAAGCVPCLGLAAEANLKLGRPDSIDALAALGSDIALYPQIAGVFGATLLQFDRAEEALPHLYMARALAPGDMASAKALADALRRVGKTEEAAQATESYQKQLEAYEEGVRSDELASNVASSYSEAAAALERKDFARCDEIIASIEKRDERFPLLGLLRAARAQEEGKPAAAADLDQLFDATVARNPWLWTGPGQ